MRRGRAVVKNMTQMSATASAVDFRALLTGKIVIGLRQGGVWEYGPKRRPAVAAIVLHRRGEELEIAAGAKVNTGVVLAVERTRKCRLGAVLAEDHIAIGAEKRFPLGLAVRHGVAAGCGSSKDRQEDERAAKAPEKM